eukprot:TRINITY_DN6000_c0_g1_i1.p1 TRINITY_DN6000_c0_g1~~TRINITY_DN6000_c0_g1_i1.p1  ORF type:complete len:418 (+),score=130.79 TRINITY_DN6000_c0_g1_i1:72-1256(+)
MEMDTSGSSSATNSDNDKLVKLLEFYFGDVNLQKDRWMSQHLDSDGYMEVKLLTMFNKIKAITTDEEIIRQAVKSTPLLQLSDDGTKVRRKDPVHKVSTHDVNMRTVYIENIPENSTHESITKLFEGVAPVQYASLPKHDNKVMYAFVEFASKEAAQKAVHEVNKYDLQANPKGLRVISKQDWSYYLRIYKQLLEEDDAVEQPKKEHHDKNQEGKRQEKHKFTPGLIVCFEKLKDDLKREEVKTAVESLCPVAYVDFKKGTIKAHVRCFRADEAQKFLESKDKLKEKFGDELQVKILSGEEEQHYWSMIPKPENRDSSFRGGRGGRGGRGDFSNNGTKRPRKEANEDSMDTNKTEATEEKKPKSKKEKKKEKKKATHVKFGESEADAMETEQTK